MNELSMLLDEMIAAGNSLVKTATALKEFYSSSTEDVATAKSQTVVEAPDKPDAQEKPSSTEEKTYSYEEVRCLCATKAAQDNGKYKREVLSLVKKYADGGTLSKVEPSQYAALVTEVEVIGNAG